MIFRNRREAGLKLAEALQGKKWSFREGVVLAVPRGGVVVGAQIARELKLPLDLIIPRKIGAPHDPEVAIGAVAQNGAVFFERRRLKLLGLREEDLQDKVDLQVKEIRRRMKAYRGREDYPFYHGKGIILVDDGIATGHTIGAAIRSIKSMFHPRELILAVPVAPLEVIDMLAAEVDEVVCLYTPSDFYAVGQFYVQFEQVVDEEVARLLRDHAKQDPEASV